MPNHITNIFDVLGKREDVLAFKKKVYKVTKAKEKSYKRDFDFSKTVPMPKSMHITCPAHSDAEKEIYKKNKERYGAGDWYEFAIKYWSTKWGGYDAEKVEKIEGGLRFRFNTAWSPPTKWITTTAAQFHSLKFIDHWKDEGGGCGLLTVYTEDGEVQSEEEEIREHDWFIEFDNAYREEYKLITEGEYKDVLEKYQNAEETDYNSSLNEHLLKRIEDKDLPLFINFEWYNQREEFESRLKGSSKPEEVSK